MNVLGPEFSIGGLIIAGISGAFVGIALAFLGVLILHKLKVLFLKAYGGRRGEGLSVHPLFATCNRLIAEAESLVFVSDYKTILGRFLLISFFDHARSTLFKFASEVDSGEVKVSHSEFAKRLKLVLDMVWVKAKKEWEMDGEVPEVLIERLTWYHQRNVQALLKLTDLEFVHTQRSVEDCVWGAFNLLQGVYTSLSSSLPVVVNGANGSLAGRSFRGVVNANAAAQLDFTSCGVGAAVDPVAS